MFTKFIFSFLSIFENIPFLVFIFVITVTNLKMFYLADSRVKIIATIVINLIRINIFIIFL